MDRAEQVADAPGPWLILKNFQNFEDLGDAFGHGSLVGAFIAAGADKAFFTFVHGV